MSEHWRYDECSVAFYHEGIETDMYKVVDALNTRIAELEEENDRLQFWLVSAGEEIDQLTAHSDIERQDDKWIPEVQE